MNLSEQHHHNMILEKPQQRENNGTNRVANHKKCDSNQRATTRVAPTRHQFWQKFRRGAACDPARSAASPKVLSLVVRKCVLGLRGCALLLLALICFSSPAFAKKIEILQADRLELRNVTTPDGKVEEYVIITGKPAIVRIDKDELEANRIEFNKTRRKLYIVGQGVLRGEKETIAGNDFVVDTSDNSLEGVDVLIATTDIDVVGISVERLPGQKRLFFAVLEMRQGR
jgi:hypothetical protein